MKRTWNVSGRKVDLRMHGEAILMKVWVDCKPVYGMFCTLEGVRRWVEDNKSLLDWHEDEFAKAA